MRKDKKLDQATLAGVVISLGIVFGDIGTSPFYAFKAIIGDNLITEDLVLGGVSCIFWTLTLQTTLKYVVLTMSADNNGEGGIFSLYTLIRRRYPKTIGLAIVGGAALLADGIITPPISITSAVEGLEQLYPEAHIPVVPIVLAILSALFLFQRFGTELVGKAFGPIMVVFFSMLSFFGFVQIVGNPLVLKAFNPWYAYNLLTTHPESFWILGAVFLCTTGAEALYSDMGHTGKHNIYYSWTYVKISLLINYLGQAAWCLKFTGQAIFQKPFYGMMPAEFLPFGIVISTAAAVIASQALITGSFTLVAEAVRLNILPRLKLKYPASSIGQIYIPAINTLLFVGCCGVVLYFRESTAMESAYGLSITVAMIMTTFLMTVYLSRKYSTAVGLVFCLFYLAIEGGFMAANLTKFKEGGYVTVIIGGFLALVMIIWVKAHIIKNRLTQYTKISEFKDMLRRLSNDKDWGKYATNLVFMSASSREDEVENKIVYSLFARPKRADIYWFVHVEVTDDPYTMKYKVDIIEYQDLIKVTFFLGFKVEQLIHLYMRRVIEDLVKTGEIEVTSEYRTIAKEKLNGDFRYIILHQYLSNENELGFWDNLTMQAYFSIQSLTSRESQWFGLESNLCKFEKVPLVVEPYKDFKMTRIWGD